MATDEPLMDLDAIAAYRRDGFLLVRGLIAPALVARGLEALSGLAASDAAGVSVNLEPAVDPSAVPPEARLDHIRKYGEFVDAAPALMRLAMSARLHGILDQILGRGRVLFQDMALIKPPGIGSEKPWHQDAAYFRVSDPALIVGAWIALDPADRDNGCMEVIPRSHLGGPVPHVPAADINVCTIRPDCLRLAERTALPMDPGDVLIFHSLLHHYTAPNRSGRRRRAVQFHYHQLGLDWTSLEHHRQLYQDDAGGYAGCTVPTPPGLDNTYRQGRPRPVVPQC